MSSIGEKIRFFRKRIGMSQLDLENLVEAAPGSLSRIESGEKNPTKETILRIIKALNLGNREIDYLMGVTLEPATEEEIKAACDEVKDYFSQKGVIAYLIDERYRFLCISNSFPKFIRRENIIPKFIGKSFISMVLSPEFKVEEFLDPAGYEMVINNLLIRFNA